MLERPDSTVGAFTTLELRGLGRDHGQRTALQELSLTVTAGEFVALLGPSGAGKSTALHCVAGLLHPSRGSVLLDGRSIDAVPPEHRGFGVVFQHHALFPHLSVRDNVAFGLTARTGRRQLTEDGAVRVEETLARLGLAAMADRRPGQLSGGQQQRVAIARAIVLRPRLLLMDEPLSNLDPALRLDLRGEIKRLHRDLGLTTLYVTHDQEEALSMADRLVVLEAGRVEQIGTPEQVHDAPSSWQVAAFVGYRTIVPGTAAGAVPAGHPVDVRGADGRQLISGTAATELAAGEDVRVAIRPEDLQVSPGRGDGVLAGTVLVTEYLGRRYAVTVDSAGQVLHATAPTDHAPGTRVALSVPPRRALVFPANR